MNSIWKELETKKLSFWAPWILVFILILIIGSLKQQLKTAYEASISSKVVVREKALGACHITANQIATKSKNFVSFNDVLEKSRTDKREHHYGPMYAEYLDALRLQGEVNMMEIGLKFGGSVEVWTEFFESGRVFGMDLFVFGKERMKLPPTSRIKVFEGDQANVTFLNEVKSKIRAEVGELDFIVDDGGHTMEQQKTSFTHLMSLVKPGGFYFIEDLQTSYYDDCPRHCYGGGEPGKEGTTIELIKSFIDVLNADYYKKGGPSTEVGIGDYHVNPADKYIGSIQCWRNMCAIRRKQKNSHF